MIARGRREINEWDELGSVWFGALMRNARWGDSAKFAKTNGDPGAIRRRAKLAMRIASEAGSRTHDPSFGGWAARVASLSSGLVR